MGLRPLGLSGPVRTRMGRHLRRTKQRAIAKSLTAKEDSRAQDRGEAGLHWQAGGTAGFSPKNVRHPECDPLPWGRGKGTVPRGQDCRDAGSTAASPNGFAAVQPEAEYCLSAGDFPLTSEEDSLRFEIGKEGPLSEFPHGRVPSRITRSLGLFMHIWRGILRPSRGGGLLRLGEQHTAARGLPPLGSSCLARSAWKTNLNTLLYGHAAAHAEAVVACLRTGAQKRGGLGPVSGGEPSCRGQCSVARPRPAVETPPPQGWQPDQGCGRPASSETPGGGRSFFGPSAVSICACASCAPGGTRVHSHPASSQRPGIAQAAKAKASAKALAGGDATGEAGETSRAGQRPAAEPDDG